MTTEEEIKKAEQEVNRAKKKLAEAKRKAQKEKRAEENSRKFMMGGLVAKYLREDMELDFMDFSEEEITRKRTALVIFSLMEYITTIF